MKNKITKIEIQKNNKNRVNIYIDSEYSFACSLELVFSQNLKLGNSVDIEKIKEVVDEDNFVACKDYALNIIDRNLKTEKEMYEKLKRRDYSEEIIKRVFVFLKEYKLIDDVNYTNLYIREKIRKQGRIKIRYDLLNKGVSKEIIEVNLNDIDDSVEVETAMVLAKKKYENIIKTETQYSKTYSKLQSYMMRLGYRSSIINEILRNILKYREDIEDNFKEENCSKISKNEALKMVAEKRYNIIRKSENDKAKIYKKLWEYLLRRGYSKDEIKNQLIEIMSDY